jgi:hypothetical protein
MFLLVKAQNTMSVNTCLEIFAGTKSFTKVARTVLLECEQFITIDIDPRFECTFTSDIMVFDYQHLIPPEKHVVTHIWMSPPCTEYSKAKTTGKPRDLEAADSLVRRGIEIIRFYQMHSNPSLRWYIENPRTGLLKTRDIMKPLTNYYDVNYCRYAPWGMRKLTRIWTNVKENFTPKLCFGSRQCPECILSPHGTGRYIHRCTPANKFYKPGVWSNNRLKSIDVAQVPPKLIEALLLAT